MRRNILLVLTLLTCFASAQKRHEYTFDFTKPQSLNPPIELQEPDYNGAEISLQNVVLKSSDGYISVSFLGRADDGRCGVLLTGWPYDDGTFDHSLFIARGGDMVVTGNGVQIDTVKFSSNSFVGNLKLTSPTGVGLIDARNESWYSNGAKGITSLTYHNNGQNPEIKAFTVIYRSPLNILEPIVTKPLDNSEVTSFRKFEMSFDKKVKLGVNTKGFLEGPIGFSSKELYLSISPTDDHTIIASLEPGTEDITTIGSEYTIVIPENSVVTDDEDGYYNKQLIYHFSVVEAHDTFEKISVYPLEEDVDEIPNGIIIEFPSLLRYSTDKVQLINTRTGEVVRELTASYLNDEDYSSAAPYYKADKDIYCFLRLNYSGDFIAPVKTSGIYTLTIPEGFVGNSSYKPYEKNYREENVQYNPQFTIKYNVKGAVYPSDETLQAAKELLAQSGAGYPSEDSPARIALQALVNEGIGDDAIFKQAMAAFYAEEDIEKPSNGYYLISAVSSEGGQVFLSYENGSLGLTKDVEEAVHLLATVNDDGTVVFKTPDGKYLSQLLPDNNNVTNSYDAKKNSLTFSKFSMDGLSPEDAFGLWSINVWLKHTDQGDITAFARVNTQTLAFSTDRDEPLKYFSGGQTNAFRLTETSAPIPAVTFSLNPALGTSVESLYHIELTFTNVQEVAMSNDAKAVISLIGSNSLKYAPTQVAAMDGARNKFMLTFDEVKAGTYTFAIPKGTFTWTYEGRVIQIPEIKGTYTVKSGVDFKYDFQDTHVIYYHLCPDLSSFNRDVDLDKFILAMKGNVKISMSDKPVKIMDVYEQFTFAQGHLVPYSDPEYPDYTMLKFVLDKPIVEGSFEPGKYCFVVDRATFGDENYGRWLQDPQSVSKTECHVNYAMDQIIDVNNDRVNIQLSPDNLSDITRLSQITITLPYHENVEIPEDATIVARNYDYDNPHAISSKIERVEGTTNCFRFTSDEALRFSEDADARRYSFIIPKGFFKCGTVQIPSYDDTMFFYYTGGNGDVIEGINVDQQQGVIFDLSGRRVKDMNKAGIYIVGGRKVVVK